MPQPPLQVRIPGVISDQDEDTFAPDCDGTNPAALATERRHCIVVSALKRLVVQRCLHQISAAEFESKRAEFIGQWFDSGGLKERRPSAGGMEQRHDPGAGDA